MSKLSIGQFDLSEEKENPRSPSEYYTTELPFGEIISIVPEV
jgi:hypothetical protein